MPERGSVGSLEGADLPDPDWTGMPWKRDKMVLVVQRHFQGQEFGGRRACMDYG